MGPGVDKLFLELTGRPIIAHTWARFDQAPCIDQIVLVIRAGLETRFEAMAARYAFAKPHRLVPGGARRQDSVGNGLQALEPGVDLVAIHDGARPCTSVAVIERTLAAARTVGAAVAAQRVTDTVKESDDGQRVSRTLDRSRLWTVQTPQAFRTQIIRRALQEVEARGLELTDDTAACELIGQPVAMVETGEPNPKVTVPADLAVVELLLRAQLAGGATGQPCEVAAT
jgi:2-C-methyl-D-erythritol 4-phosphate cytidylyltransferase